jgi:hypothetical protein
MQSKAVRCLIAGQLSLFGFLLVCLLLIPHFLTQHNEGGVSNYGLYAKTVIPYSLAFGLCGILTLRAAWLIPKGTASYKVVKRSLIALGIMFLVVLVSTYPYKVNDTFNTIHIYAGSLLTLLEMLLGGWFALFLARGIWNIVIFAAQIIGIIIGVMTRLNVIHVLFITEMLTSLAFGALLVRTMARLTAAAGEK